jgi:TonB family protein
VTAAIVDATLRVSAVLLIALGVSFVFRRRSAALRHWILAVGITCAAATPALQVLLPSWQIELPGFSSAVPQTTGAAAVESVIAVANGPALTQEKRILPPVSPGRAVPLSAVLVIVWLAGAAVCASVLLVGFLRLSRLAGASRPIECGRWLSVAAEVSRRIGLDRRVALLQSDEAALLVTWGVRQPKIILPAGAATWPEERARVVLQHELAHVLRRDWAAQMLAEVLRAVYWFNPLLWIACRRLRVESELACDDAVLNGGVEATEYASHLVDLARTFAALRRPPGPALAMARTSSLEGRVSAMLNARLNRRPLTRLSRLATAAALFALVVPVVIAAQNRFSTLAGTVLDQMNRPVPAATLTLTNASSGAKYEVHADKSGHFEFVGLLSGDYQLTVAQPGFAMHRETVNVAGDSNRTIGLQVGSLQETITVASSAAVAAAPEQRQQARSRAAVLARKRVAADCPAGTTAGEVGGSIVPPLKIVDIHPVYPAQMRAAVAGGVVTLSALIGTDGTVRDVKVVSSSAPEFETAAMDAVRQWEFTPTYLNCTPIDVRMQVTVNFVSRP